MFRIKPRASQFGIKNKDSVSQWTFYVPKCNVSQLRKSNKLQRVLKFAIKWLLFQRKNLASSIQFISSRYIRCFDTVTSSTYVIIILGLNKYMKLVFKKNFYISYLHINGRMNHFRNHFSFQQCNVQHFQDKNSIFYGIRKCPKIYRISTSYIRALSSQTNRSEEKVIS